MLTKNKFVRMGGALTVAFGITSEVHAQQSKDLSLGEFIASGTASWYGEEMSTGWGNDGRRLYNKTASGQIFDPNKVSAAHPTLDLHSCIIVVTKNGRRIEVDVNDRGPYAKDRILDLSRAAAEQLKVKQQGEFHVSIYRCPT